jgi:hypothetical protein
VSLFGPRGVTIERGLELVPALISFEFLRYGEYKRHGYVRLEGHTVVSPSSGASRCC